MLNSVLDAKITDKVVRLGSQSTDDRIKEYSLRSLEKTFNDASTNRQIRREYAIKKKIEDDMYTILDDIQIPEPSEDQIKEYLQTGWEEHLSRLYDPPFWIVDYATRLWESEGEGGEWTLVQGRKGKGKKQNQLMSRTYYGLWKRGLDIAFIQPPQPHYITTGSWKQQREQGSQSNTILAPPTEEEQEMWRERMFNFFYELGYGDMVPKVPTGNRIFVELQDSPAVWSMSLEERRRLAEYWEEEMRRLAYHNYLGSYKSLRRRYNEACEKYEAVSDDVRVKTIPELRRANDSYRGSVVCSKMST